MYRFRVRLAGFQILPETETVQFLSRNVSPAETETAETVLQKLSDFRFVKERMVVQLTSVSLCIYIIYLHNEYHLHHNHMYELSLSEIKIP